MGEERFKKAFEGMVEQAIALGAVKGCVVAVDSTAFKAYSARDATNKRGKSDPDADVGRAGRTYILGYRVHLASVKGDLPLAFTVQPISRNDKLFYKQLLEDSWKTSVKFRIVAGDRQYNSAELRQWTKEAFKAEAAIPTIHGKGDKHVKGIRVDSKFRVTGPKCFVKAYHESGHCRFASLDETAKISLGKEILVARLCAERIFKKLKRQLNLENHHYRGLANVTIHACITLMCVLAVIIASYKAGKPKKAGSIRYWTA